MAGTESPQIDCTRVRSAIEMTLDGRAENRPELNLGETLVVDNYLTLDNDPGDLPEEVAEALAALRGGFYES